MFWKWLSEKHPVANEVIWWTVDLIGIAAIIISIISLIRG